MGVLARFKKLIGKASAEDPDPLPELHWILASENPFGIDVLDCRRITQGMVSMTGDESVAKTFGMLRSSQGRECLGQKPKECLSVACELEYPPVQTPKDGPLFKAAVMEDKWDIYLYDSRLYFCRSWSGVLRYRARIRVETDKLCVTQIDYAKSRSKEPLDAVRVVDYLIKSHLYRVVVPHPFPRNMPNDPETLALDSFSRFGRRCRYGSYDDTLKVRVEIRGHQGSDR